MVSRVAVEHPDLAFDFAMAHMAALNERLDATSRSRYYAGLAGRSADPAMLGKLKAYAAANVDERSRRDTDTAAANIADRIRVRASCCPRWRPGWPAGALTTASNHAKTRQLGRDPGSNARYSIDGVGAAAATRERGERSSSPAC